MNAQSVCAVMITYHPTATMLENIPRILAQVQALVVVDNGSRVEELSALSAKKESLGFHVIENGQNLGVAEALNQGVRWARSQGYSWVILFDQDSGISHGFVHSMFAAWESHPDQERVGSIHPRYVDAETDIEAPVPRDTDSSPILPMTSGSLIPARTFAQVGWFASEYFIDLVDWEYAFRLRKAGYRIADASQARLFHAPGSPAETKILGHTVRSSHQSAVRRYYICRNSLAFCRKFFLRFPRWVLIGLYIQMHDTLAALIAEPNRALKFRNCLLGVWDGLTGRMGKREGL